MIVILRGRLAENTIEFKPSTFNRYSGTHNCLDTWRGARVVCHDELWRCIDGFSTKVRSCETLQPKSSCLWENSVHGREVRKIRRIQTDDWRWPDFTLPSWGIKRWRHRPCLGSTAGQGLLTIKHESSSPLIIPAVHASNK